MNYIEIFYKDEKYDVVSKARLKDIEAAGYPANFDFKTEHIYKIDGELSKDNLFIVGEKLLVDPIIQNFEINSKNDDMRYKNFYIVDVWLKKGVTDPVGETIENSIKTLGIKIATKVNTGFRYLISKNLDEKLVEEILRKVLMNSVIQEYKIITNLD